MYDKCFNLNMIFLLSIAICRVNKTSKYRETRSKVTRRINTNKNSKKIFFLDARKNKIIKYNIFINQLFQENLSANIWYWVKHLCLTKEYDIYSQINHIQNSKSVIHIKLPRGSLYSKAKRVIHIKLPRVFKLSRGSFHIQTTKRDILI